MKKITLGRCIGLISILFGALGMAGLVFFYGSVLFSDKWTALKTVHEEFRLLFTVPSGIVVIYSSFLIIFIPLLTLTYAGVWLFFDKKYIGKYVALLIALVWVAAIIFGSVTTLHQVQRIIERVSPFSSNPVTFDVVSGIPTAVGYVFKTTLKNEVTAKLGMPIEGYEPFMFLETFPGLTETDFENVEASIGHYTIEEGRLVHKLDDTKLIHSAAKAVTDSGLDTLLANVSIRLGIDLAKDGTLTEIMEALIESPQSTEPRQPDTSDGSLDPRKLPSYPTEIPVACTMDAKICPDGSAVGRQGPKCEFASCPVVVAPKEHLCTQSEKKAQACTMEYAPVCASVAVQCIKAPCPPVPQTFGNGCSACSNELVTSYIQGECKV